MINHLWFVDAGEQIVAYDTASDYNVPEKENVFELVIARDRNRARTLFIKKHTYLDYTDVISVRQMRRDIEREQQVIEDEDDPLWQAVDWNRTRYADGTEVQS